jgi:hypothetical protein
MDLQQDGGNTVEASSLSSPQAAATDSQRRLNVADTPKIA